MLTVKIIILCISVYLTCFFTGILVCPDRDKKMPGLRIVYGLMTLWALFFVLTVVFVLNQMVLYRDVYYYYDHYDDIHSFWTTQTLTYMYSAMVGVLALAGLIKGIIDLSKKGRTALSGEERKLGKTLDKYEIMVMGLFFALVLFQLVKSVFFAYSDGDDSYYVSVAQLMAGGEGSLYMNDPYTGYSTSVQFRYALAPFPIWVGFLARVFSLNAATVAHICMPLILIPITYVIYNAIGEKLFENNFMGKYMFLCLFAVFVLFAHYSYNSAEVFLLTRTRQGKEALANIIIPLVFYDMLMKASCDELKYDAKNYISIILITISAALTSVFGNILVLMMLFAGFVYSFYRHASIKYKLMTAGLAVIPLSVVAVYYLV